MDKATKRHNLLNTLNQLLDDWIGKIACGLNFGACATAATIHCLGPVEMEPGNN